MANTFISTLLDTTWWHLISKMVYWMLENSDLLWLEWFPEMKTSHCISSDPYSMVDVWYHRFSKTRTGDWWTRQQTRKERDVCPSWLVSERYAECLGTSEKAKIIHILKTEQRQLCLLLYFRDAEKGHIKNLVSAFKYSPQLLLTIHALYKPTFAKNYLFCGKTITLTTNTDLGEF